MKATGITDMRAAVLSWAEVYADPAGCVSELAHKLNEMTEGLVARRRETIERNHEMTERA